MKDVQSTTDAKSARLTACGGSANERDLLSMLKWLVGFHQPGDARAVVDAEPMKQARKLVERIEAEHSPNTDSANQP